MPVHPERAPPDPRPECRSPYLTLPRSWPGTCYGRSTLTPLHPRTVQILAEAYELTPHDVALDNEIIQALPWSGLDLLVWLRRRHNWDASLAVYYLAAIKRE